MLSTELLSTLQALDHADKLRVMQFLVNELAREEGALLPAGTLYEVWSPYNAPAAAGALLQMLQEYAR